MNYKQGLMQVCFLTQTAANSLNAYRDHKQRALGRELRPDEYIFTHQKSWRARARAINVLQTQIASVREQLSHYDGKELGPLIKYLVNHHPDFNYQTESEAIDELRHKLNDLELEAKTLQSAYEPLAVTDDLKRRVENAGITFTGEALVKSEGPVVILRCRNCKTNFIVNVGGTLGFLQVLNANTVELFRHVQAFGANEFIGTCGSCNQSSKFWADRDFKVTV